MSFHVIQNDKSIVCTDNWQAVYMFFVIFVFLTHEQTIELTQVLNIFNTESL